MKKKTKLLIRDAFLSTILSCVLLAILSIALFNIRFFNVFHKAFEDFSFLDVFYSEKFVEDAKINDAIILVNIENLDREGIAILLEAVLDEQPKVVGFDIILENRSHRTQVDSILADLLKNDKVVTVFNYNEDGTIVENDLFFATARASTYANFDFDFKESQVIREFIGIKDLYGATQYAFATKLAKAYLSDELWNAYNYDKKLSELQYINYSGNIEKYTQLNLLDFSPGVPKPILKDKIVIMGFLGSSTSNNAFNIEDKLWTPLNKYFAGKSDRDMYGTVVHANIVNMLIKNDLLLKVSNFWLGVITFIGMFFSTMLYIKLNRKFKVSYRTRKQTYQLFVSIGVLIIVYGLLKNGIVLRPFIVIAGILLAGSYFKYYKHLVRYIKTKRKWKTYIK
ncbi:MAG: CHASE2 domain-containing protein [Winogradskyella sp.]|uniref:CHASE2 domain-containing protein n=1 Tax=Winogradskyella sp. TaxID=1883156 RepID=UPI0018218827|nr:CHASE2 domain-containing protein [Winogradskyella sp.]